MGICFRYVTCLLCLLFVGTTCQYLRRNAAFAVMRERRQAGYVYDRPPISFNLPSRTPTVASTSTQATNVDRTSAQQMYYAYPAPAGGSSVDIGYSNTGSSATTSTSTSGASGYNYNSGVQNVATGSTGSTTSTITSGSGSSGYSYGGQNTASVSTGGNTVITTGGGGGGGGSDGYRYSVVGQNIATGSVGTSTSTATADSGSISTGYDYGGGGSRGITTTVTTSGGSSGSGGYNYETQNIGNRGTQTVTSTVSNLYNAPSTGSNTAVTVDSISTNAPQYLPPTSEGGSVSVTTNTQIGSGSPVLPTDTYIPPVQQTSSVTTTQTGRNLPTINVVTQKSNTPISGPSTSYLQPSTQQQISNVQSTQTQVTGQTAVQVVPTPDYLPPVVNTGTQISVSTPAATYLPPVF